MQRSKKMLTLAASAAAVAQLSLAGHAQAADVFWDGGAADSNLTSPQNWVGDATPLVADAARFDAQGASDLAPTTDGGAVTYRSIFFGNLATLNELDAYVIGGANAITLGFTTAGNYLNNDSETLQTINAPVNMIGGTVNATSSSLQFGGLFNVGNGANVAGNNVTFFANTPNTITLNGGIAGTGTAASAGGAITKTGTGTMFVNGASSAWGGNVFINGGALRINNADALGSGGGRIETALTSGGTGLGALELDGGVTGFSLTKPVTTRARQAGTINEVSLRNISGNNTINNVATGSGGSNFNYESAAGNLSIGTWNTTATGGARGLRLLGAANGEILNWTPAAGNVVSVVKDGTGTWNLRAGMNNANGTFTTTTVNGGTLVYDAGLGARATGNVSINAGGTLQVVSPDGLSGEVGNNATPTTVTVRAGGTLNASTFNNYSLQVAQTFVAGGTIQVGQISTFGDNAVHIGDAATSGAVGTMNVQGNLSLSNAFSTAAGGLHFDLNNTTTPGGGVNDLISIAGNLLVDNSGGPINLRINPFGAGGLANGTYRLIDFTGTTTATDADFAFSGGASATRQLLDVNVLANQVNLDVSGAPGNLTWQGDGSSNVWEVNTLNQWLLNGTTPDKYLQFDNVTFGNSANTTVNLVGTLQPTNITVNSASNYTFQGAGVLTGTSGITKNGTGTLVIANTGPNTLGGPVTITQGTFQVGNGGADGSIGTGAIANDGTLVVNKSVAITIPGVISGTGSLVKQGTGDLALSAANTYTGPTSVEAGRVFVTGAGTLGDPVAGTTVLAGAQVFSTAGHTNAEPFTLAGDGPVVGDGAIRAGGAAVTTLTAPLTLGASASLKIDGGAQLILSNTVTGSNTNLTLRGDTNSTGRLDAAVSLGAGGVAKEGAGTWVLAGTGHTWTGGTTINGGTLQLGAGSVATDLPAGALTIAAAGTLAFGSDQTITFSRTVTGAGTIAQGVGGGKTTLTGDLTGFTGTVATSQGGVASTLEVATATNANALVASSGAGNGLGILRLTHSNALISGGTISIQAQQATGTGRLELGNNVNIPAGTININPRNNATATILSTDGSNSLSGNIQILTGGDFTTLEAAAGAQLAFGGTIQPSATLANTSSNRNLALQGDGNGTVSAVIQGQVSPGTVTINVVKNGAGTWTLSGANTYTGTTTVNGGTLVAANGDAFGAGALTVNDTATARAQSALPKALSVSTLTTAGTGKLDMTDNDLVIKTSTLAAVQAQVTAGFNGGTWDGTGINSSAAATNPNGTTALGYGDNAELGLTTFSGVTLTGPEIIVKYTYYGDADLTGVVDLDDFGLFLTGYQNTSLPRTWIYGDFDYTGVIDLDDFGLFLFGYQNQGGPLSALSEAVADASGVSSSDRAFMQAAISAVPEPASLVVLGLAAVGLLGRRSRRGR